MTNKYINRRTTIYLDDILMDVKDNLSDDQSFSAALSSIVEKYKIIMDYVKKDDINDDEKKMIEKVIAKGNFTVEDILFLDLELKKICVDDEDLKDKLINKVSNLSILKKIKLIDEIKQVY